MAPDDHLKAGYADLEDVGRARAREGWQGETPAGPTMSR
jgi:hypothetical protein